MPYVQLMRIDRPIGVWLLMFPAFWGIAFSLDHTWGTLALYPLFALGALVIRSAGCIYNDMLDRDLDVQVTRTKNRPLVAKTVPMTHALILLMGLLITGFIILITLNRFTLLLGVFALFLIGVYPLMKRITYWPQAFLGLTMNWGLLMGYCAIHESLSWGLVALYGGACFWTLGYDTIYAHQDREDDLVAGIKSTALKLQGNSKEWVGLFYVLAVILVALAGLLEHRPDFYYAVPVTMGALLGWQWTKWMPEDAVNCLHTFKSNKWIGVVVFCGIVITGLFS